MSPSSPLNLVNKILNDGDNYVFQDGINFIFQDSESGFDTHDGGIKKKKQAVWVYKPPEKRESVEVQVLVDVPEEVEEKKRPSLKISRRKRLYLDELKTTEKLWIIQALRLRLLELLTDYEKQKQLLLDRAEAEARERYEQMLRDEELARVTLARLKRLARIEEDEMLFLLLV